MLDAMGVLMVVVSVQRLTDDEERLSVALAHVEVKGYLIRDPLSYSAVCDYFQLINPSALGAL